MGIMTQPIAKRKNGGDEKAHRISVSLPRGLALALDRMVRERGFHNRSQAVAEMIEERLNRVGEEDENRVMAGTITLFLETHRKGLLQKLRRIQKEHIAEVISCHDIFLEDDYLMEVVLVQGPVGRLRQVMDLMLTCKGVSSGDLSLTSRILPQVHR